MRCVMNAPPSRSKNSQQVSHLLYMWSHLCDLTISTPRMPLINGCQIDNRLVCGLSFAAFVASILCGLMFHCSVYSIANHPLLSTCAARIIFAPARDRSFCATSIISGSRWNIGLVFLIRWFNVGWIRGIILTNVTLSWYSLKKLYYIGISYKIFIIYI